MAVPGRDDCTDLDCNNLVRVTLQLTVSQSVCLGVEPNLGLLTTDIIFSKVTVLSFFWGALSDERSGLSFVSLCQYSLQ
jgi:hypothetical protein